MPEIKVDKDVPLTQSVRQRAKYPFASIDVGDSFFVARADEQTPRKLICRVSNAVFYAQKRSAARYITRTVEKGVRVWRTE